jgi:DnaJ homolog subfamily C member 3
MMFYLPSMKHMLCALVILFSLCSLVLAQEVDLKAIGKVRAAAEASLAAGDVPGSLQLWNQVIELEHNNGSNYYKRFRVYLRANKFKEAISDLNKVIEIIPRDENAVSQRAKLHLRLGRCLDATQDFALLRTINHAHKELSLETQAQRCEVAVRHGEKLYSNQRNYKAAKEHYSQAIGFTIVTSSQPEQCTELLLKRAHCSFFTGENELTIADTGKILKMERDNMEALTLRGNAYYVLGELDTAKEHYRQALKYDPEHAGSKTGHRKLKKVSGFLSKAQKAMLSKQYTQAIVHLDGLITSDPTHQVFVISAYIDLATANKNLGKLTEARAAINEVLKRQPDNVIALKTLGQIQVLNEEYEASVATLRKALDLSNGDQSIAQELQKAEAALKRSKQKDYYKILGIKRNAKVKEIKKAYREKALEWHPDKHQGEEEKAKAEEKFTLIAEAAEVLGDAELRGKYDRGEEVFPNQGNDGGGQRQRGHPFGQGGFPGGFNFHFGGR